MKYLSVCSGIEAASVAWEPLGWEAMAFSEVDKFPSALLASRFPRVPNLGDMNRFREWDIEPGSVDVLVGGTPCQSFSVAGLRKGLDDPRGNLALVYLGIAERLSPRWIVWENVPGVLSRNEGRDFACILGGLTGLNVPVPRDGWRGSAAIPGASAGHYGCAYRVLDAQHFGCAV